MAAALLGHKADLGLMVLGPDLWRLRAFQTEVQASGAVPVASYVSLTEISEYAAGVPEEMRQARLFPQLPPEGKSAFCFYPMSKRRSAEHNWYSLDFESRKELMMGHGKVGRTFHGRVLQVITGSTGLDDFEWGVTLFGVHPDDLKDCVYEMRFDEASSRYAEFGPFYAGMVGDLDAVLTALGAGRARRVWRDGLPHRPARRAAPAGAGGGGVQRRGRLRPAGQGGAGHPRSGPGAVRHGALALAGRRRGGRLPRPGPGVGSALGGRPHRRNAGSRRTWPTAPTGAPAARRP